MHDFGPLLTAGCLNPGALDVRQHAMLVAIAT